MTLLEIYNDRAILSSVNVQGLGIVELTGNVVINDNFGPMIEVIHNGRKQWEQGNATATAKARHKGTSPVPAIVAQMGR